VNCATAASTSERKYPDFAIDSSGVERQVNVNVRGLSRLPLLVG
jgi:hypothetical protein